MLRPRNSMPNGSSRNRIRPACRRADPVNAFLSFGYAMLDKKYHGGLLSEGLDPLVEGLRRPAASSAGFSRSNLMKISTLVVDVAVVDAAVDAGMVTTCDFRGRGLGMRPAPSSAVRHSSRHFKARLDRLVTASDFRFLAVPGAPS